MPLDPEISTKIVPPAAPALDLLGTVGKFATIQNQLNTNQLFQQTFQARQKAGQILAASPDLESGLEALYKDPLVAPFAPAIVSQVREGQATLTKVHGEVQSQAQSGLGAFMKSLPAVAADPTETTWNKVMDAHLATLSPEARARTKPAIDSLKASLVDGLGSDPVENKKLLDKRLAGMMISGGITPESLRAIYGTPRQIETGGTIQPVLEAPPQAGGGLGLAPGTLPKTLPPQVVQGPYGKEGAPTATVVGGEQGNPLMPRQLPSGSGAGGLGLSGITPFEGERQKDMADYRKRLDENVSMGSRILTTVDEARQALGKFKAGGGAEVYKQIAQVAQAFGASQATVDKIANGDLSASQEFSKLMVNTTMGQIRQQIPNGSRLAQQEFQVFQRENPNISTDPRAIEKIFNFWTKVRNIDAREQREMDRFLRPKSQGGESGRIVEWPAEWQKRAEQYGYFKTGEAGGERRSLDEIFK